MNELDLDELDKEVNRIMGGGPTKSAAPTSGGTTPVMSQPANDVKSTAPSSSSSDNNSDAFGVVPTKNDSTDISDDAASDNKDDTKADTKPETPKNDMADSWMNTPVTFGAAKDDDKSDADDKTATKLDDSSSNGSTFFPPAQEDKTSHDGSKPGDSNVFDAFSTPEPKTNELKQNEHKDEPSAKPLGEPKEQTQKAEEKPADDKSEEKQEEKHHFFSFKRHHDEKKDDGADEPKDGATMPVAGDASDEIAKLEEPETPAEKPYQIPPAAHATPTPPKVTPSGKRGHAMDILQRGKSSTPPALSTKPNRVGPNLQPRPGFSVDKPEPVDAKPQDDKQGEAAEAVLPTVTDDFNAAKEQAEKRFAAGDWDKGFEDKGAGEEAPKNDEPTKKDHENEHAAKSLSSDGGDVSPFIAAAKVDKRPLGGFTTPTDEMPKNDDAKHDEPKPAMDEKDPFSTPAENKQNDPQVAPAAITRDEFNPELLNVEARDSSDATPVVAQPAPMPAQPVNNEPVPPHNLNDAENSKEFDLPAPQTNQPPVDTLNKMNVPDSFKHENVATDADSKPVFDTNEYHAPLLPEHASHKNSATVWLLALVVVVVIVAAFAYLLLTNTISI